MSSQLLSVKKHRAFLKWAGGKYRLTEQISHFFPKRKKQLIEPFVGAGSVFLNTDFDSYILADINPDLINLFKIVKQDVNAYIKETKGLFEDSVANTAQRYYFLREQFNQSKDPLERAVLFLYLNRYGFNGLCRYNANNEFNVPFGSYKQHYFPEKELRFFAIKAQSAEFICCFFQDTFTLANKDSVVYCDPPYAPLKQATNFTHYSSQQFGELQQKELATLAFNCAVEQRSLILISNHDTPFTREIYQQAKIKKIKVQRSISHSAKHRVKVNELIAIFDGRKKQLTTV